MDKSAQGKIRLSRKSVGTLAFLTFAAAVMSAIVIKILADLALS